MTKIKPFTKSLEGKEQAQRLGFSLSSKQLINKGGK
jgi:hypothetical protein